MLNKHTRSGVAEALNVSLVLVQSRDNKRSDRLLIAPEGENRHRISANFFSTLP